MKSSADFAKILGHFIEKNTSNNPTQAQFSSVKSTFNAAWETSLEPFAISELLGTTAVFKTSRSLYRSTFVRPAHVLNEIQKSALAFLQGYTPAMKDNFNAIELRSSYRAALLKTHPDQGGSSENFWQTKKSYEILRSIVTSKV